MAAPQLCSLKNLSLHFGLKEIFKNADLSISKGDHIGLLGLNGHGKSTLFKIITGEIAADKSVPAFEFSTSKTLDCPFNYFYIPQELPLKENASIADYFFIFYPDLKKIHDQSIYDFAEGGGLYTQQQFESYLKSLGLEDLNQDASKLSGGEQKKILLALGLSSNAALVLWDEPTNHLDIETIKFLEEELSAQKNAYIIITHDRFLLTKLCSKIFQIENGKIKSYNGSYTDYIESLKLKAEEDSRRLAKLKNNLEREQAWMRRGVKARGTKSKYRIDSFHDLKASVQEIKEQAKKQLELSISSSQRQTKVLVEAINLGFHLPHRQLLNNLNFTIQKKQKIGIIGHNGVGKTTLIKLILGELEATSGKIKRADNLVARHFSQKRLEIETSRTPFEILGDGNDFVELPDGSKRHVISYFESFLFNREEIHRPLHTFSGGEKTRLQLALNLLTAGDILIFDEPTNDLDIETIEILENKLAEFEGALLIISHDRAFLSNVTNQVFWINNQTLTQFMGGYYQVLPFIEAVELEEEIDKIQPPESKIEKPKIYPIATKEAIKRRDELFLLIEKNENKIQILKDKVNQLSPEKLADFQNKEMKILSDAISSLEKELSRFYVELENYL